MPRILSIRRACVLFEILSTSSMQIKRARAVQPLGFISYGYTEEKRDRRDMKYAWGEWVTSRNPKWEP
jgi:hypothetical protein